MRDGPDELGGLVLHDDIKQIVMSVWAAGRRRAGALRRAGLRRPDRASPSRCSSAGGDVLAGYRRRWRYLQVDEHQDTNPLQDQLLRLLAGEPPRVMVVGDDQQAIYRFRSADVRNILRFDRDYPHARVVGARAQLPLDAAARRSREPPDRPQHGPGARRPWSPSPRRDPSRSARAHAGEQDEARWAAAAIAQRRRARHRPLGDRRTRPRQGGAHRHRGGAGGRQGSLTRCSPSNTLYQRREVKAALAHLALLVNPHDAEAFSRVMLDARPGIGEVTAARVDAHATAASISLLKACVQADGLSRTRRDQKASLIAFGRAMLEFAGQLERRSVSSLLTEIVRLPPDWQEALTRHDDGEEPIRATARPRRGGPRLRAQLRANRGQRFGRAGMAARRATGSAARTTRSA